MEPLSLEHKRCKDYLVRSADERRLLQWLKGRQLSAGLVVAEGFEERSLGILQRLVGAGFRAPGVIVGRYVNDAELNERYRTRFEDLSDALAPGRWAVVDNHNDGLWVRRAIESIDAQAIILDITGVANRALFGVLDSAVRSGRDILIAYTEAAQYWPKKSAWRKLEEQLCTDNTQLAEIVDKKPWLFGHEHRVELVPGHQGYDAGGFGRALIGFLPFKCARLAAVLGEEDYSEFLFIAGRPRLKRNQWRLEALKKINAPITKGRPVIDMSTFSYRSAVQQLTSLLFSEESFLGKYDVHLAIMGSKLQTVGSWVLSSIIASITAVTGTPTVYFPEAFSEGIGASWIFSLVHP